MRKRNSPRPAGRRPSENRAQPVGPFLWLNAILVVFVTHVVAVPASATNLKRMPRPHGVKVGLSVKEAKSRLKTARAKKIEQETATEDLDGKEVPLIELNVRFVRGGWPRKMRLRFYKDRLVSIKVKSDRLEHLYSTLGHPEIRAARQKRRVWYDERRLRLVGCDPLRCKLIDFRNLIGPLLSETAVRKLFQKIVARERRRAKEGARGSILK